MHGNMPIILKLSLDNEAIKREAFALKCFAGYGAAKLLMEDYGMLLLERAAPGISLKNHSPDKSRKSIDLACYVIKQLHKAKTPKTHKLPYMKDLLLDLDKNWNLPFIYLEKARTLRNKLLKNYEPDTLLHGDLHYDNILLNGDNWIVIDPKGVIGAPINEMWAIVKDVDIDIPFISQQFGLRTQDLFDWYFVHLILSICWNLEDNIDPTNFLNLAIKAYPYTS